MDKILVSACLLGDKCTYKGEDNAHDYFEELNAFYDLVPFCCEVEGGLGIPRLPSEIKGNGVIDSEGKDVSGAFRLGVYKASSIVSYLGIRLAILKERSPSCGVHEIHDGYFSGRLVKGEGLLTRELRRLGVTVLNEEEGYEFLQKLKKEKAIKDEKTKAYIEKENAPKEEEKEPAFHKDRPHFDRERKPYGKDKKPFRPHDGKFDDRKGKKPFGKKPGFKGKSDFAKGEKKSDYGFRKPSSFNRNRKKNFKKD